jgi:hypothetical protein
MQFAAHYIGLTYRDFYLDHKNLVAANIACMETFGMDAVGLISDPMQGVPTIMEYSPYTGLTPARTPLAMPPGIDTTAFTNPAIRSLIRTARGTRRPVVVTSSASVSMGQVLGKRPEVFCEQSPHRTVFA